MSLEKVIVEYHAEVKQFRQELADIKKQVAGVSDQAKESGKKTEDALNSVATNVKGNLTSAFKTLGTAIVAAFSIRAIGNFISSSIELAVRTEEVKKAFDRLNSPALLQNLKNATEGTLSDLKLMGLALKANQLQIPLEKLGSILQFAKQRADELGRSTEDLAETIIQGIGTKSTRALVQVGISQEQFGAEVKKTGDYFDALDSIITTTLNNAGEGFDSVADKQDRLRANIENTKVEIGNKLLPVINELLEGLNFVIDAMDRAFNPHDRRVQDFIDQFSNDENIGLAANKVEFLNQQLTQNKAIIEDLIHKYPQLADGASSLENLMLGDVFRNAAITVKDLKIQNEALDAVIKTLSQTKVEETKVTKENTVAVVEENDEFEESLRIMRLSTEAREVFTQAMIELGKAMGSAGVIIESTNKQIEGTGGAAREAAQGIEILTETTESELEKSISALDIWGDAFLSVIDSINQAYSNGSNYRLSLLQNELQQGTISQEQFDKQSKAIKRREAIREKEFSSLSIILSTARAVMAALALVPPNPVLAALSAVTGAAQLATVISAPIPAFKKGGKISGREQIIRVNEQGEEFIAHAHATRKHKGLLEAVNRDKVEEYIFKNYKKEKKDTQVSWDDYRLLLAIKQGNSQSKQNTDRIVSALSSQRRPHRAHAG